jgi:serine/threonine protein kinase
MESWIASRLNSPYIVKIVEPQSKPTFLYYLTEYVDGLTLGQWMSENPKPSIQDVMYWVEQIVKGLRAFHRRETLHQDIKPDNIMMSSSGVVQIIDFGSCWVSGIAEMAVPFERDQVLGTASYSSPEQVLQLQCDGRSDQFSLAVIIYQMLAGKLPFDGKHESATTAKDFEKLKYTKLQELNPLVPDWFDAALAKALSIHPEQRYFEVDEFLFDLKHPNKELLKTQQQSWAEQNPLRFWQSLAAIELVAIIYLLSQLL